MWVTWLPHAGLRSLWLTSPMSVLEYLGQVSCWESVSVSCCLRMVKRWSVR